MEIVCEMCLIERHVCIVSLFSRTEDMEDIVHHRYNKIVILAPLKISIIIPCRHVLDF
jgi:hypothetical protein